MQIQANKTKIVLKAEKEITLECGDSRITLKENGDIDITGKKINLETEGSDLLLKKEGFALGSDKDGTIEAKKITTTAQNQQKIKGNPVKIN